MIMKVNSLKFAAAALSCLGMLLSPTAMAAAPLAAPSDVALGDGGVLVGQVVDAQGMAVALATVTLADHQQEIAKVRADQDGKFSVPGLRGGVYRISSRGQDTMYRLWAPNTAPPIAQQGVILVVGDEVVRGQYGLFAHLLARSSWSAALARTTHEPTAAGADILASSGRTPCGLVNVEQLRLLGPRSVRPEYTSISTPSLRAFMNSPG